MYHIQHHLIVAFTRTIAAIYTITLLTVFTHIQLAVLGRTLYLDTSQHLDEPEHIVEKTISAHTEKLYLLLSSYLISTGYSTLMHKIEESVKDVVGDVALSYLTDHDWLKDVLQRIRTRVELNQSDLIGCLMDEETQFVKANIHEIQGLINETRDILESVDLGIVVQGCLNDAFSVLNQSILPIYFPSDTEIVSVEKNAVIVSPKVVEIIDSKSVVFAGILPKISRFAHGIVAGSDNIYVNVTSPPYIIKEKVVCSNQQLQEFTAIIYTQFK